MVHSYPGAEDIQREEFDNGMVVLSRANINSPAVVIKGYLHVGGLYDPDERLGLADFTASALLRGAGEKSFQEIYDLLESCGASLSISSGTHTTSFAGQALAEDLPLLLDLLSVSLRWPTFPEQEVERLRTQLLTGLMLRAQSTEAMAQMAFDQIVYADHPYSRPEDGFPETIRAIQRQDLIEFHQVHYGPRQMVIAIVGAVEPGEAIEQVGKVFGDWRNPRQPMPVELPPVKPLAETVWRRVNIPGKAQADLVMGVAGPPRRSPDFVPANLGNSILGQFGMMGRLGEQIREKAGLVYYIQSNLSGGLGPGAWDISAGVDPQDVEEVVELVQAELRRFTTQVVTDEELSDVQESFIGSLPLSLESNYGVAAALINLERYQLGLDYYRNYAGMIRAVTREDILRVAQRYLDPERLGIGVAGPLEA